jgi:hypothetical protein
VVALLRARGGGDEGDERSYDDGKKAMHVPTRSCHR